MNNRVPRTLVLLTTFAAITHTATAQTWEREDVNFQSIESRAKDLANKPFVAPDKESLPKWMKDLTYDQYRDIRFNPDRALWSQDKLPFRAMLFHPGYNFKTPVM